MDKQLKVWLHGLVAAVISGGAGGVVNSLAAVGIRPDAFNFNNSFKSTAELAGVSFLFCAFLGLAFFLKQSPLPPEDGQ